MSRCFSAHPAPAVPQKIVIIRIDSIGDFVIFTCIIKYLREKYNTAQISIICNKSVVQLAEMSPYIDRIIICNKNQYIFNPFYTIYFLYKLKRQHFDLALYPVYSREIFGDEMALFAAPENCITFEGNDTNLDNSSRLKNNKLYTQLIKTSPAHDREIDKYLDFLAGLEISPNKPLMPELWLTEEDKQKAKEILSAHGIDLDKDKNLILFPAAQREIKLWPALKYAQLGDMLYERYKVKLLIGGAKSDVKLAQEVAAKMTSPAYVIAGEFNLREMAVVLEHAKLYVGNDTGILHIAVAMGTPTVCIMGGGHFGRFFPYGDESKNKMVYNKLDCFNCNWRCIYDKPKCIESITVEQVYAVVESLMGEG